MPESRGERAARRLTQSTARGLRFVGRPLRPLLRVPIELRIGIGVLAFVVGGFFATVVPLLTTGGHNPTAEVTGRIPATLSVGQAYDLPVALDNTSGAVINPVCIVERSDPAGAVDASAAVFQGLETIAFHDGRACGGSLSGQEVISVRVTLVPRRSGPVRVTLVAAQGGTEIGPGLSGAVQVGGP